MEDSNIIINPFGGRNIRLQEHQIEHFNRLVYISSRTLVSIDCSPMGSGKNILLIALAMKLRKPILAICPSSALSTWKKTLSKYQIPTYAGPKDNIILNPEQYTTEQLLTMKMLVRLPMYPKKLRGTPTEAEKQEYEKQMKSYNDCDIKHIVLTYGKLRSKNNSQPTHGLLHSVNGVYDNMGTGFIPTERLNQLFQVGIIIAFDEMHHIKNQNMQSNACRTLTITCLKKDQNLSRLAFLSGTPFDKQDHAFNVCEIIGFIRRKPLCNNYNGNLRYVGAEDLYKICLLLNREVTNKYYQPPSAVRKQQDVKDMCYRLFINVVKPSIISRMPPPNIEAKLDIANGFYNSESGTDLHNAVVKLSEITNFSEDMNRCEVSNRNETALKKQLETIEILKVPILIKLARQRLTENKFNKVIIYVTFRQSTNALVNALMEFTPMVVNGEVTKQGVRENLYNLFQNSPEHRLLIIALGTGSESINLNDKDGRFPRYMYIVPSHELLKMLQAMYRIYRVGTKSDATIRFIYGKYGSIEHSILSSIIKKKEVLKDVIGETICLDNYPNEYENENGDMVPR